jgi:hypothetical protein
VTLYHCHPHPLSFLAFLQYPACLPDSHFIHSAALRISNESPIPALTFPRSFLISIIKPHTRHTQLTNFHYAYYTTRMACSNVSLANGRSGSKRTEDGLTSNPSHITSEFATYNTSIIIPP